jgi:hypothetical protein
VILLGFSVALRLRRQHAGRRRVRRGRVRQGESIRPYDNKSISSGALYIFTRQNGAWSQQAYIKGSKGETSDGFGFATADQR